MSFDAVRDVAGWARTLGRVAVRAGLVGHSTPRAAALALKTLSRGKAGLSTALRLRALSDTDRPAFVFEGRTLRYGEVDARIARLTAGLASLGLGRGDAVALALHNRPEFFELEGAMARRSGAAVSVSWRSTPAELAFLLQHSGAKALCFEPAQWGTVEAALAEVPGLPRSRCIAMSPPDEAPPGTTPYAHLLDTPARPDDDPEDEDGSVVIYTSGTTGKPKGAVRRFGLGQALGFAAFLDRVPFHRTDRHLCVCPLYHSTALGFAGITLMVGGCVVIERGFDPLGLLQAVERERVTTVALVPTMLHRLMALPSTTLGAFRTRTLRAIVCGGAQLPGPLATRTLDQFGPVLYNFYGATETGLVCVATPDDLRAVPGTIGRALHGVSVRLLDEDGRPVPPGSIGELYARSTMLVDGYHRNDEATREALRDGHFSVGDLATVDPAGRYTIVGRRRDMVISGGVNLYPAEIEAVLDAHPAVSQSAVIGTPDPEWGERLRAFVVLRSPVEAEALARWCRTRMSGPKVPREWAFVEELPSNPTGKILKRSLAEHPGPFVRT